MITRVTITGADDNTPIEALLDLSKEFPWVEWGILVSRSRECSPRYPSRAWCTRLMAAVTTENISMHVCGTWARAAMAGIVDWRELPDVRHVAQRIQINGAPERGMCWSADSFQVPNTQIIFQVPAGLEFAAYLNNQVLGVKPDVACLFDCSGGRGITPAEWPAPIPGMPCGYAGGIGPENVEDVMARINEVCAAPFWIDMEGRLRDDCDRLDLDKVRNVLDGCAPLVVR